MRNLKTHKTSATDKVNGLAETGTPVGKALQVVRDVRSACPYTALGRKAVSAMKGKQQAISESGGSDRLGNLQSMVKTGRNIALIGFLCPIFWFSLLSGVRGAQLRFNAIHSGIVMLIGLAVMIKGKIALKRAQSEDQSK